MSADSPSPVLDSRRLSTGVLMVEVVVVAVAVVSDACRKCGGIPPAVQSSSLGGLVISVAQSGCSKEIGAGRGARVASRTFQTRRGSSAEAGRDGGGGGGGDSEGYLCNKIL